MVGGVRHAIATRGVLTAIERLSVPRLPALRLTLPASPWGPLTFTADPEQPLVARGRGRLAGALVACDAQASVLRAGCELAWSRAAGTIELAIARDGDQLRPLAGQLERLIPVRRPGRDGSVIEGTYALVRFVTGEVGWAEITVVAHDPDAPGAPISAD